MVEEKKLTPPRLNRSDLKVYTGGKIETTQVAIHRVWREVIATQHAFELADLVSNHRLRELEVAEVSLEGILSNKMSSDYHRDNARKRVSAAEHNVRMAGVERVKADTAAEEAERKYSDTLLEHADIPGAWRKGADVRPLDNVDDGSADIFYGNTSSPEAADWDGHIILYANGEMERVRTPKSSPPRKRHSG